MILIVVALLFIWIGWIVVCTLIFNKKDKYAAALRKNFERVYTNLEAVRAERDKLKAESIAKVVTVQRGYEAKLAEKDARVQKIIDENSHIQWQRDPRKREQYNVFITVNPDLFGGVRFDRDDLMYIARYLGDQVAHEFGSLKFIQKAREFDHSEYYRRPQPFTVSRDPGPISPDRPYP